MSVNTLYNFVNTYNLFVTFTFNVTAHKFNVANNYIYFLANPLILRHENLH